MAGAVPQERVTRLRGVAPAPWQGVRAGLLCATAALLSPGYVLAAAVPLLLAWLVECGLGRRWPWDGLPLRPALFLWTAVVLVTAAVSPYRDLAVPNAILLAAGAVAGLGPLARTLRERPQFLPALYGWWVAGAFAAGVWVVARYAQAGFLGRADLPQLGWNAVGTVLAAGSVVAAGVATHATGWKRWAAVASQPAILLGLLATLSRGAWLGWLVGLTALGALIRVTTRRVVWAAAGFAAVAAVVSAHPPLRARAASILQPQLNRDRLLLWQTSLRMLADHPWAGVGFGAFARAYPGYRVPEDPNTLPPFAHNLPLSLAVETGVPGLLAFAAFLVGAVSLAWRHLSRAPPAQRRLRATAVAALTGVLTQQLVDGTLQSFHLGFAFWLLLGISVTEFGTGQAAGRG